MKKFLTTISLTIIYLPMWVLALILVGYMAFIKQPIVALFQSYRSEAVTYKWFSRINDFMDRLL